MNRGTKEDLINLAVMLTLFSAGSIVWAANNNWRIADIISLEQAPGSHEQEIAQADIEIHGTPTPGPTPTQTPYPETEFCFCNPAPPPSPTPVDNDRPPLPTPTPDTSTATTPFVVTLQPVGY